MFLDDSSLHPKRSCLERDIQSMLPKLSQQNMSLRSDRNDRYDRITIVPELNRNLGLSISTDWSNILSNFNTMESRSKRSNKLTWKCSQHYSLLQILDSISSYRQNPKLKAVDLTAMPSVELQSDDDFRRALVQRNSLKTKLQPGSSLTSLQNSDRMLC